VGEGKYTTEQSDLDQKRRKERRSNMIRVEDEEKPGKKTAGRRLGWKIREGKRVVAKSTLPQFRGCERDEAKSSPLKERRGGGRGGKTKGGGPYVKNKRRV